MLRTAASAANAPGSNGLSGQAAGFDLTLGSGLTGLVGRNGSGKSTLLKFIAGRLSEKRSGPPLISGDVIRSGAVRLLDQTPDPTMTLSDLFEATEALADLRRAQRGEATYGPFEAVDWGLEDRIRAQLDRFGLPDLALDRSVGTLSGGQQLRAALAALFFDPPVSAPPEILLLDEPTNALDLDAREALISALTQHKGLILIASHDRALLEHMDRIVALEPDGSVSVTGGGWSAYSQAREAELTRLTQALGRAERDLKQQKSHAHEAQVRQDRRARQGKRLRDGSQSKMLLDKAKEGAERSSCGRLRAEERRASGLVERRDAMLQRVEAMTPVRMGFPAVNLPASKVVLELDEACFVAGAHRIGPLSFSITGPERVWLKGPNGSGKSTLLRGISGEIAPVAGQVLRQTELMRLDQSGGLQGAGTLLEVAQDEHPELTSADIRATLARAGFRGDAAEKPANALSGGERLRAAIALMGARDDPAPLLLLDEPSNHLDLDAIEALEAGLSTWGGAMILVSHDPSFVQNLGSFREIALDIA
ncbi:ABC-F family ATP-binding cassette domain-containing protein [Celeribacter sp. PS-C1]|uniref:ABC-F family ATP-binding cassette domain-containing protein n=1 Tax=Celeribacter sp. PS-C1 TaxID=2820813 RepID=UPI00351D39DC